MPRSFQSIYSIQPNAEASVVTYIKKKQTLKKEKHVKHNKQNQAGERSSCAQQAPCSRLYRIYNLSKKCECRIPFGLAVLNASIASGSAKPHLSTR